MRYVAVFPKVSAYLSEKRVKKKAFGFLYRGFEFDRTWNIKNLSRTLFRLFEHSWYTSWEVTGPGYGGGHTEKFFNCHRCHAWYAEGGKPTTKTCIEVRNMDRDEVLYTGGK